MQNIFLIFGLTSLALSWLLPGHYPPWATFQQQWLAALAAALLAAAALAGPSGTRIRWPLLCAPFLALALVPAMQGLIGQVRFVSDAVLSAVYLLAFALTIATGASLATQCGRRWREVLFAAIVVGAIASTGFAAVQWLEIPHGVYIVDLERGGRPYGNLAQPNHLATLICMGIAATLGLYEWRRVSGPTCALMLAWLVFGLLMTQSRTAWLYVACLAVWWLAMCRRVEFRSSAIAMTIAVALFALGVVSWSSVNDSLLLSAAGLGERVTANLRLIHWGVLADAISKSPWVGYGWLQVSEAQHVTALAHPAANEMLQDSHNVILDLMIWMGVPGCLVVVAAVGAWLATHAKRCRKVENWVLLAAIGAVLTHSLLEYPLDYTFFLFPLGLLMGTLDAQGHQPAVLKSLPRWTLAVPTAGLAAMLIWIGVEYMRVENSMRQLRLSMVGAQLNAVSRVSIPDVALLDAPREYQRYWQTPARAGMTRAELDWMRAVMLRNSAPPAMLRYALALGLNGEASEAARTLALLCRIHMPKRCEEGRASWDSAKERYPELQSIEFGSPP